MTVEDIARDVVAAIDTDAGWLIAAKWVAQRYRQLCSRTRFRHLRNVGEIVLPAPIVTGVATFTRGSTVVTGDTAAQAVWSSALVGQHIRGSVVWYEIDQFSGGNLILKTAYAEDSFSGAYRVQQRWFSLDPSARWLGQFVHPRRRLDPLQRLSLAELNSLATARPRQGPGPEFVADVAPATNGGPLRVEFYPYPDQTEQVYYVWWETPPTLATSDSIPAVIPDHVLKEGALIDLYRYEMGKAEQAGKVDSAGLWRNEMRAQMTSWERNILEAVRSDRGEDDATFIMRRAGIQARSSDIRTAYDQAQARWPV